MIVRIAAFTAKGLALARRLGEAERPERVMEWTRRAFREAEALIFVGAAGIAVRAIAPHVRDKARDPAVVVLDEAGKFVVPILSGHIGGANELARQIARQIGATPVITTATDVNGLPAIDEWAARAGLAIENPRAIAPFAAAELAGERVGVAITDRDIAPPFPVTLFLRPRTLAVGVGCRRGVDGEHLESCLRAFLKDCGVSLLSVAALATIEQKADEPALLRLSARYQIPLRVFSAPELMKVPGVFSASEWVRQNVGADNVCERAAVLCAGRLLQGKTVYEGLTLALAGEDRAE